LVFIEFLIVAYTLRKRVVFAPPRRLNSTIHFLASSG
jgi:hypothetical protein